MDSDNSLNTNSLSNFQGDNTNKLILSDRPSNASKQVECALPLMGLKEPGELSEDLRSKDDSLNSGTSSDLSSELSIHKGKNAI